MSIVISVYFFIAFSDVQSLKNYKLCE